MEISIAARKAGIQTKSNSISSCADSHLRPRTRLSDTSKDLTRLAPRFENRKSAEWWGIVGIEEQRLGVTIFAPSYRQRFLNPLVNDVPGFFD
ncbi:hypothetical protein AVEN_20024-1 [Araneus ventricosus]|uniref:Uncharacterized protein n=1 Tax=Araneus ventricosus TaxID=182803 RepID=A0A4Y2HAF3_ARAVE|nr:hypothetical protein AVEN_20024-1 [Araneus ventricosus]